MAKITVCSICGKEYCDGQEWIVPYQYEDQAGMVSGVELVCTSQTEMRGVIRVHKMVTGHMIHRYFRVYEKPKVEAF